MGQAASAYFSGTYTHKKSDLTCLELTMRLISTKKDSSMSNIHDFRKFYDLTQAIRKRQQQQVEDEDDGDRSGFIDPFLEWCDGLDILHHNVEVYDDPQFGLGLKTMQKFGKDEALLSVPYPAMVNSKDAFDQFGDLIVAAKLNEKWGQIPVALMLLNEKLKGRDSPWKPYLDILPQRVNHPAFFTPKDFVYLQGASVLPDAMLLCYQIAEQYGALYQAVFQAWQRGKQYGGLHPVVFTFDSYRWALVTALTRSLKVTDPHNPSREVTVVAPFWDLCNHASNAEASTKFYHIIEPDSDPTLYATASRKLSPDTPITISYLENCSPDQFFSVWGFTDIGSLIFVLSFKLLLDRSMLEKRRLLTERTKNKTQQFKNVSLKISVRSEGNHENGLPISHDDLRLLLILHAVHEDLTSGHCSQETWCRTWDGFCKELQKSLDEYLTNLPDPSLVLDPLTKLAVGHARQEKEACVKILGMAQKARLQRVEDFLVGNLLTDAF